MKKLLALAALIMIGGQALAITTNPASNVTADSDSTPMTIPLRDANGQFNAAIADLDVTTITVNTNTIQTVGQNVGIGTLQPNTRLHVSSGVATVDGSNAAFNVSGNITATKASVQVQAVGSAANMGAYGAGTTYLDAMNAAGNDGLRIDNGGAITRYSSGAKGVITLPAGGGVSISGTGAPTTGGMLCLNSSNVLSKCTSAGDGSGNCTCP